MRREDDSVPPTAKEFNDLVYEVNHVSAMVARLLVILTNKNVITDRIADRIMMPTGERAREGA